MICLNLTNDKLQEYSDKLNSGNYLTVQDLTGSNSFRFSNYLYDLQLSIEKDTLVIKDKLNFKKELPLDTEITFGGNSIIVITKSRDVAFMVISNSSTKPDNYYETMISDYMNYSVHCCVESAYDSDIYDDYSSDLIDITDSLLESMEKTTFSTVISKLSYKTDKLDLVVGVDVNMTKFMDYLEGIESAPIVEYTLDLDSTRNTYENIEDIIITVLEHLKGTDSDTGMYTMIRRH